MFKNIIYFLTAILSTMAGSLTGMGGGVIIKPVLDCLGDFNAQTIGILSSFTVFAMAIVSVSKQIYQKTKIDTQVVMPIALGAVTGGFFGETMLNFIVDFLKVNHYVVVVQNVLLAILIIVIYFYMEKKENIKSFQLKNKIAVISVGVLLGIISSFLGIGGGPINVALFLFLFSYDTKTATLCSVVTILFSQISKLLTVGITTGFAQFNLAMLPVMIVGAILGGFIGTELNKRFSGEMVEFCFKGIQIVVFALAIYNAITHLFL